MYRPFDRLYKITLKDEFSGIRPVGRPRFKWEEGVKGVTRLRCRNWNPTAIMGDQGSTTGCSSIGWIVGYRGWCMMSFCSQASVGGGGGAISGFNCLILKVAVYFLSYRRVMFLLQCLD